MDVVLILCLILVNLILIGVNNDEGKRGICLCVGIQVKIYNVFVIGKVNNLIIEIEQIEKFLIDGFLVLNYIVIVGDIKVSGDGGYFFVLFIVEGNYNVINQILSFSNIFIGIQDGGVDLLVDSFFEKVVYKGVVKVDNEWIKGWIKL